MLYLRNVNAVIANGNKEKRKPTSKMDGQCSTRSANTGVKNWKEIASDRIRWRGIVKAVLA
jgi:hypothetical protein